MYCGVTDINTDGVGLCEYARIVLGQTSPLACRFSPIAISQTRRIFRPLRVHVGALLLFLCIR